MCRGLHWFKMGKWRGWLMSVYIKSTLQTGNHSHQMFSFCLFNSLTLNDYECLQISLIQCCPMFSDQWFRLLNLFKFCMKLLHIQMLQSHTQIQWHTHIVCSKWKKGKSDKLIDWYHVLKGIEATNIFDKMKNVLQSICNVAVASKEYYKYGGK